MTKRNNHTFKKHLKETKRKEKAKEKLDRRQGKNIQDFNGVQEGNDMDSDTTIALPLKKSENP